MKTFNFYTVVDLINDYETWFNVMYKFSSRNKREIYPILFILWEFCPIWES